MDLDEPQESAGPPKKLGRFGRFLLQEVINSGGMADIYVATDDANRTFALRKLRDDLRFNFQARRRFFQGCEVLSKIHHHENIVNYIEHGKISGSPYLLMDYVESSNLKILLGRTDEILAENVAQIIIDMAVGLEHVHDSGYMHLDFKPENILVTRSAAVRLVDFDLARPKPEQPEKVSRNPGTPAYMAPEQLQRKEFDHRADIFALGVTMYEVLTGSKPFPGENAEEILRMELNGEMSLPRELNPDIPIAMEKVILKCMKRNMTDRYPYMSVVVRDVQAALYV